MYKTLNDGIDKATSISNKAAPKTGIGYPENRQKPRETLQKQKETIIIVRELIPK
jgi:hypothetical protein